MDGSHTKFHAIPVDQALWVSTYSTYPFFRLILIVQASSYCTALDPQQSLVHSIQYGVL